MDHGDHDASPARCNMNVGSSAHPSLIPFPILLHTTKLTPPPPDALHLVHARPLYHLPQLAHHRPHNTHPLPLRYRRSRGSLRGTTRHDSAVRRSGIEAEGGITSYVPSLISHSHALVLPPPRRSCAVPCFSCLFLPIGRVLLGLRSAEKETTLNAPRRGTC